MNAWSKAGPAHHCAVGIGHLADKIGKLGALAGLDFQQVC
jgi:L-arabinose isomerase